MTVTVRQLAEWVKGEVLGDPEVVISDARTLTEAVAGDITFVEDDRRLAAWHSSKASAAIVPLAVPVNGRPIIRVGDPLMAFARVIQRLRGTADERTAAIDPCARVHPSAVLGPNVDIGPFVVVGEGSVVGKGTRLHPGVVVGRSCRLGEDVTLHPHVVLADDCVLGDRVVVHANAVIGADGFGYRTHDGKHVKVPQLGSVEVADDVEIGACTTIDRGTFGPTRIGAGTKIDNLVMIAHNCQIGRHNIIAGQVGIAGSVVTGEYVVMAGQVGVADHLTVGDRVHLGAKTGIRKDTPADSRLFGDPATTVREQLRNKMSLARFPQVYKDVERIKRELGLEDAG